MTILHTATYGIAYCDDQTALVDVATVTAQAASTIEDALIRGGIAPPTAADLAQEVSDRIAGDDALGTRVSSLESSRTADEATLTKVASYVTARPSSSRSLAVATGSTPTALVFDSATQNPAGGWAAGNPSRLVAVAAGEYDLLLNVLWPASSAGYRFCSYRINGGSWVTFADDPNTGTSYGKLATEFVPGLQLAAGDYLEVGVWQDSGATLTLTNTASSMGWKAGLRRIA